MESVNFDKVWESVGELGRYQVALCAILMVEACLIGSFTVFSNVFILYTPDYWCGNDTSAMPNCANGTYDACNDWQYETNVVQSSAITKYGMLCEYNYIGSELLIAAGPAISIIGALFYGHLSDRFGRKNTIFVLIAVYVVSCIPSAFMNNLYAFIFIRWWIHLGHVCTFACAYLYALECTGPSKRTMLGSIFCAGYATGAVLLGGVAYLFNDVFSLILAASLPFLLLFLTYPWVLESPRWLWGMGRREEAIENIVKFARWNGRKTSREEVEKIIAECVDSGMDTDSDRELMEVREQVSFIQMFHGRQMRIIFIVLTLAWGAINITYTAIAYNVKNIGGSFYPVYVLQAFVEAPAVFVNIPIINHFGRVWPLVLTMVSSGLCSLVSAIQLIPTAVSVGFAILAKFLICMSYGIIYQLASELYPTEIRGKAYGFTTLCSAMVTISMPFVVASAGIYVFLPMVIIGLMCSILGLSLLILPETKHRPMLENLQQVEDDLPPPRVALRENWEDAKNSGIFRLIRKGGDRIEIPSVENGVDRSIVKENGVI